MTTIAEKYGVVETNGLEAGHEYHASVDYAEELQLSEVARLGGRISRVRVLTGSWAGQKMADVSYIHATLPSGQIVPVRVTGNLLGVPLWGPKGLKSNLIAWAREEGVYAKALGLLDEGNWSVLY